MKQEKPERRSFFRWSGGGKATRAEVYGLYIAALIISGGAGVGIVYAAQNWEGQSTDAVVEDEATHTKICHMDRGVSGATAAADCTCVMEGLSADLEQGIWNLGGLYKDDGTPECLRAYAEWEQLNAAIADAEFAEWLEERRPADDEPAAEGQGLSTPPSSPSADNNPPAGPPPLKNVADPRSISTGLEPGCFYEQGLSDYVEPPEHCWCTVQWTTGVDGVYLVSFNHSGPGGDGGECHSIGMRIRNQLTAPAY